MRTFIEKAQTLQQQIVEWRRHAHSIPEIGFEVPKTAAFIAGELRAMGVEVEEGIGRSGVVGLIRGREEGPTFGIRADIDALEVEEKTGLEFASTHKGKMHACGHDGHIAIALATAKILQEERHLLPGTVKMIFQPGEEGWGGAKAMIDDGVLKNPDVEAILALHLGVIWDIPSGSVGYRKGPLMASSDQFEITIKGTGGHGAMPHKTVDAVAVGAQVITALQSIISRNVDPLEPAVLTVSSMEGGQGYNIIQETAQLKGTVRCLNPDVQDFLEERIEEVVKGVTRAMGGDYQYSYLRGYPSLQNDAAFTDFFAELAGEVLGPERVVEIQRPTMGAEDMAYFLEKIPGTLFALGSGSEEKETAYPHHNPRFNIDEDVLWLGAALFSTTAWAWLKREKGEGVKI